MIEPRLSRDTARIDGPNKRWASVTWERGEEKTLRESGFDSRPFTATRWDVNGYDTYGRSPGMDALGDVKQLQTQQREKSKAIAKFVTPPMVAPTTLKNGVATQLPGGLTYADTTQGQRAAFYPAIEVNPAGITAITNDNEDIRDRVRRAFFADVFMAFMNDVKAGSRSIRSPISTRSSSSSSGR